MSAEILLDEVTAITTLVVGAGKPIRNNNGIVSLVAHGTGTTFSATIDFYPVYASSNNWFAGTPVSVTISNAAPFAATTINTPHATYVAVLSAFTGSAKITAIAEG